MLRVLLPIPTLLKVISLFTHNCIPIQHIVFLFMQYYNISTLNLSKNLLTLFYIQIDPNIPPSPVTEPSGKLCAPIKLQLSLNTAVGGANILSPPAGTTLQSKYKQAQQIKCDSAKN